MADLEQRSRSWVISEAIRRYTGGSPPSTATVREVATQPWRRSEPAPGDIQVWREIKRIREEQERLGGMEE